MSTSRSTSNILQYFKWKFQRFILQRKQSKLLKYYETQKYDKLAKLFKTQKDYQQLTLDEFPFLYFMISQNNTKAVKQFVNKYPHKQFLFMNDSNPLKCTPIQYSTLENKQQIQKILQQQGSNLHVNNTEGQNILHLAAIYKRLEAFNIAIKRNIDHNSVDVYGNTPFHYAARVGSVEMITTMVVAKAKKIANNLHQYPIHMAIQSGKIQCVKPLENDITRPYPKYHPIHSAARSNSLQIFKYVYDKNPKQFLLQKDENQSTALHHAVSTQCLQIVKFILQRLPKHSTPYLDAIDKYGNTPLHLAFLNSNIDILKELTQKKPNFTIKNNDEMTPMDYGLNSENMDIKRFLMDFQGWRQHNNRE